MPTALSVAKEFIRLSHAGDEPQPLTPLSVQKLLHYAQGWSLVIRHADLFTEPILALKSGPAVRAVWKALPQDATALAVDDAAGGLPLDEEEAVFVKAVWDVYGQYAAGRLTQMTRTERPWLDARGDRADAPISGAALHDHFSRRPVPSRLSAHAEHLAELGRRAREEMAARPPLDEEAFRSSAARRPARAKR